jgi:hypothetical protein
MLQIETGIVIQIIPISAVLVDMELDFTPMLSKQVSSMMRYDLISVLILDSFVV